MTLASRIVIMDKGVIQQDGTPEEVFDRPENLFVATFIGSPNMNILTASAADKAGVKVLTGEGFELPVPNALADSVIQIGKDYKVGVRPHLLEPVGEAEADLAIDVKVVENLGTESVLVGRLIGNERTEISVLRPGVRTDLAHKRVHLKIPPDAIHVFDVDTGLALR